MPTKRSRSRSSRVAVYWKPFRPRSSSTPSTSVVQLQWRILSRDSKHSCREGEKQRHVDHIDMVTVLWKITVNQQTLRERDRRRLLRNTVLTTETVRANDRFRIWTGSLVCCFPFDALPSFDGSLVFKIFGNNISIKNIDLISRQTNQIASVVVKCNMCNRVKSILACTVTEVFGRH